MKLCFLVNKKDNHSQRWIQYFTEKGHQIYIVPLRKFPFKFLDILFNIFSVRRWIKKVKPDILHAHYAGVWGVLGALSGFHPFILTAHGSDILIAPKNRLIKPFIKFVLKKADLITCDAEHMKKAMIKLGADFSKIKIIYFGIDIKKFSPGLKDKNLLQRLNLQDEPIIISLRNFDPVYNLETLIKAIPIILKENPKVKFIIAGRGPEEKKLKNLAKNLKVLESIRFIGWVFHKELPQYLRTADVYVSTSLSDAGIASSTAEAMACELPVVITSTGENEKWVENGKSGYLISVKDSKTLADRISYLLRREDKKDSFGKAGRKIIEERNSYHREMEKMDKIYKGLTKNNE